MTKFDGRPASETGAGAMADQALAIQAISATSYRWTLPMKGKPFAMGVNTIEPDGRSFKEVNWLVGKPGETYTMIYERQ